MADLFDVVVARKLSGGGGGVTVEELNVTDNGTYTAPTGKAYSPVKVNVSGGGSSDFSIAEVTVRVGDSPNVALNCAIADNYESEYYSNYNINIQNDTVVNVILYKGSAFAQIASATGTITTSGSITEYGGGAYGITGDCTITIS